MTDIHINDALLEKYSLTLEEALFMILCDLPVTQDMIESLQERGFLIEEYLSSKGESLVADMLNDAKRFPSSDARIERLAERLMEVFPKGKKEGTPYYWKGNKKEIKDKLKKFFVYFGNSYTDDQIVQAARMYVASFNGDYRFMRLLKYFIWKNDIKRDAESTSVEQVSELASYIENSGQESSSFKDLDLTLR